MDRAPSIAGSSGSDLDPGGDSDLGYELDLKRAIGLIKRSQARRVGLQAPEGLKRAMPKVASRITEETGAEVLISADPCYGACDVDMSSARRWSCSSIWVMQAWERSRRGSSSWRRE